MGLPADLFGSAPCAVSSFLRRSFISLEIFCFGGSSSGLVSATASAVVTLSSPSTSSGGGRISASLEAASDTCVSCMCWCGVLARCRRRVQKGQRRERKVKHCRLLPSTRYTCAYTTAARTKAKLWSYMKKGPNAGGRTPFRLRTIIEPCACCLIGILRSGACILRCLNTNNLTRTCRDRGV